MVPGLAALALASLVVALPASAQQKAARDPQRERPLEEALAAMAPAAVQTFRRATEALDAGRPEEALALFQDVARAAPTFTPALRRAGYCLVRLGRAQEAIALTERAVRMERTSDNLLGLAVVLASPTGKEPGPAPYLQRAITLAREAAALEKTGNDPDALFFMAQVAMTSSDFAALREAASQLLARFPRQPATHYFAAVSAAIDSEWIRADAEIDEAERLGLPHEAAAFFRNSGVHTRAVAWRVGYVAAAAFATWAVGLGLLFVAGKWLSAAVLRSIESGDPNVPASTAERALRQRYRTVIRVAGIYYYVSLPFVFLLVLGTTAAIVYGFMLAGWMPVQLVFMMVIGALLTVYKMVQSLFVRVVTVDDGRAIGEDEAPGLWRVAREVAEAVQTRPVDEIRITPGTDMAVYERGTAQERARDEARRVLLVGMGLLHGFRQRAFRAVLAHEYGHFSNRDTAGGDIALRVRQDMLKFAVAIVQNGQNVWWNVGFHFLRLYDFLFRRISHGATRLQEVLADRVAAQQYGAAPFEEGLRHVIRRTIEFGALANREAAHVATLGRDFSNVYGQSPTADGEVEQAVATMLAQPTTEDDTHPSALDRFRLVNAVTAREWPDPGGQVWDLFADPSGLSAEMTALLDARVRQAAAAG